MPIVKHMTAPNGSPVSFHKPHGGRVDFEAGVVFAQVASWSTEQAHDQGAPIAWMWPVSVPISRAGDTEAYLTEVGEFAGGAVAPDSRAGIEAERRRRLAAVSAERDRRESASFPYLGTSFDCSERAVLRMLVAAAAARAAKDAAAPYSVDWTTSDGTIVALDADQVLGMLPALAQYGTAVHDTAKALRAQVVAANTLADLETVQWP